MAFLRPFRLAMDKNTIQGRGAAATDHGHLLKEAGLINLAKKKQTSIKSHCPAI